MIEGRTADDQAIGPSGFVTRVATPQQTATALVRLVRDVRLRRRMGAAGRRRVTAYYQRCDMLAAYHALYTRLCGVADEGDGASGGGATGSGEATMTRGA